MSDIAAARGLFRCCRPALWLLLLLAGSAGAQAPRAHIVFLLGADPPGSGYFASARAYFRTIDPQADIVSSARSLAQVREELKRRADARPWGRIVLVAHGTEWTGLLVRLFDAQTSATLSALLAARRDAEFPPLPVEVIDADTELVIESCGLGRRVDYLAALANLFVADPAQLPRLTASRNLVWFGPTADGTAARRELPYRATVLHGVASGGRRAEATASLRRDLATDVPDENAIVTLMYPLHVHITAAGTAVPTAKGVVGTINAMPNSRIDLGGAGLNADAFVWNGRPGPAGVVEFNGEATLVLTMQRTPEGSALLPAALDLE